MLFSYLSQDSRLQPLYRFCTEAEQLVKTSPDSSVSSARKALEYIVKLIYSAVLQVDTYQMTLFEMMSEPAFVEFIDDRTIIDTIHRVRKAGNTAAHSGGLSVEQAMDVLENLYFLVGESCVLLGVVENYPPFDPAKLSAEMQTAEVSSQGEGADISSNLIQAFMSRFQGIKCWSELHTSGQPKVNIHVNQRRVHEALRSGTIISGIDPGADSKNAFAITAEWIQARLPDIRLQADYVKNLLIIPSDSNYITLAVKSGSPVLGTKDFNNEWTLLPGIDYILYSPEIDTEQDVPSQLHMMTREAFLAIWEELGLIRKKVSGAAAKRYRKLLGSNAELPAEKYADVMTVQSFKNSRKKHAALLDKLRAVPVLSNDTLKTILKK